MWTTAMIRRHIRSIPEGQPFSTRQFLAYGLRAAVDQALYRMVKDCEIVRLARGIFIKLKSGQPLPDARIVAETKAKAFGKQLFVAGRNAACQLGLISESEKQPVFAILGKTSSFQFGTTRIIFKGISAKESCAADSKLGLAMRALRYIASKSDIKEPLRQVMQRLNRVEKEDLHRSAALMPAWISNMVYLHRPGYWWGANLC